MEGVLARVHPTLLERRSELGLDLFDEMWEGVLHMNPPPRRWHQELGARLLRVLATAADREGLCSFYETGMYAGPEDYRTPDHSYCRPEHRTDLGISRAELVVEIRSPGDLSYEKLDWYVARGVAEVLVIEPDERTVGLFRAVDGRPTPVAADDDGLIALATLDLRVGRADTADGSRLRVVEPDGSVTDI